jgi:hypothetical protein
VIRGIPCDPRDRASLTAMPVPPDDLSTINLRRFDPTPPPSFGYRVAVLDGPEAGREVVVDDASPRRLYAGTAASCDLRVTDRAVSRRHLALELHGDLLRL